MAGNIELGGIKQAVISTTTQDLFLGGILSNNTDAKLKIVGTSGALQLLYNNAVKLETSSTGVVITGTITGTASTALYADLAEKYLPDTEYSVGTVVMIGGEKEITSAQEDEKAIGVISQNPAYMMNSELQGGQYVALKGRVPVKIDMPVKKGDKLIPSSNGFAKVSLNKDWNIFAITLEDSNSEFVEAIIL
jgi:hypothetical protein